MFSSFWRGKRVPVQDIGSWSAEDCLLDICLLVLSMLKDTGGGGLEYCQYAIRWTGEWWVRV